MNGRYLLDTSVLSLLAPRRPDATPEFLDWVRSQDRSLFISTITVAEIEQGIAKLIRVGGSRRAEETAVWLRGALKEFGDNTLPVDVPVAHLAGQMSDAAFARGKHPGLADVFIAATAKVHDLLLLTRNMRHFQPLGIAIADPLAALPD